MKTNTKTPINDNTVKEAYQTLQNYKSGKGSTESRIIENEQWWRMRHYNQKDTQTSASAWLFNSIINKHADAMDNLPTVSCLPRERGDIPAAKLLSDILPVILEQNKFEHTYSDCWYDKLKAGTACYGVFWDPTLDDGLGNIDIRRVDILNLFWEPGITNIQHSKNIFHVELWDGETLRTKYPILSDCFGGEDFDTSKYIYDDSIDTSDKIPLIDWYYKKNINGHDVLHFCKFACGRLLYASENEEDYRERGFYDHGKYPFILDKLYPIQGTPCGFGVIDAMRNIQHEIDTLSTAIVNNARMAAQRRYFVRSDGALNEKEFADFTRPFVHYSGSGDPNSSIMPINTPVLSDVYVSVLRNKIDELKETSGNRDFSQGSASGGVTAAAAIAALQEAGSKTSRDMISGTYRAFEEVCSIVISLISQFYEIPRYFRIIGEGGLVDFAECSNSFISPLSAKVPVFDLKIRTHKKSAYSTATSNELACQLYKMGVFNPEYINQAEVLLSLMEFEGKDEALSILRENAKTTKPSAASKLSR